MPRLPQRDSRVPPGVLAAYMLKHRGHEVNAGLALAAHILASSWDPKVVGLVPVGLMETPQLDLFD